MTRSHGLLATGVAAMLLVSTAAHAATTLNVKDSFVLDEGTGTASLIVAGFQPGVNAPVGAVLTGVSVTFSGGFNGILTSTLAQNRSTGTASAADNWFSSTVTFSGGAGIAPTNTVTTGGNAFNVSLRSAYNYDTTTDTFVATGSTTANAYATAFNGATTFGTTSLAATDFAFYDGVSAISWDFDFVGNQSTTGSTGVSNSIWIFERQWDVDVIYSFDSLDDGTPPDTGVIPLPAAGWLLLSGLFGLGGLGWMRRKA